MKVISENRKARHNYAIDQTFEAGLVLRGTEVKSLRNGRVDLKDSFARILNGELFLMNAHIDVYEAGNRFNHEPERDRKLLMKRSEIDKLRAQIEQKGMALVPLKIYFSDNGRAKVELGLGKGKKKYDKRDTIDRETSRKELRDFKNTRR